MANLPDDFDRRLHLEDSAAVDEHADPKLIHNDGRATEKDPAGGDIANRERPKQGKTPLP